MPKFTVNTPDGKTYTVNAPEGATHEDAINHVKQTYYSVKTSMPQKTGLVDKLLDSPVGGVLRGMRDPVDAGAQLLTRGLEAVSPAGSGMEAYFKGQRENVENINKQAEADYKDKWRRGEDIGFDFGRLAGNVASSYPLAALVPGMTAATLPTRMAAGAGAGAISGAMQPVNNGDFWEEKRNQVFGGAALGAVAVPVAEKAASVIGNIARKISARISPQQASGISDDLAARGVDFSRLSKETQEGIIKDADAALKAGGKLDMDAVALKYQFDKLGIQPTLGQLNRNPMQYQFERNNAGIEGAGETLSQRFNDQNRQLVDAITKMKNAVGGADDAYTGNVRVQSGLRAMDDARSANVTDLYTVAKNQPGRFTQLNPHRFTNDINDILDKELGGYALPSGLQNTINKIAKGDAPFGIQEAEQIKKMANQYWDKTGQDGARNFAIGKLKDALNREVAATADDLMMSASNGAGNAARETALSFKIATKAARQQKNAIDKIPALKYAVNNDMPDPKFVEKFVINAKPRELMNLRSQIRNDKETWQEIRGQVVEFLKTKATGGQLDEFAKFSQSGFKNGLKTIGDARMKILFSPSEIEELNAIHKVAAAIQVQPAGSVVNNSGTSQAIANLMSRLSNVPYLKELAINPLMNYRMQSKVASALNPQASQIIPNASALPPELIRRFNLPLAVGAYPILQPASER